MPRRDLGVPPTDWPSDVRSRFEAHVLTAAQRARLRPALGRWFRISRDLGLDASEITLSSWRTRTDEIPKEMRNCVRQALAVAFPSAASALYADAAEPSERPDERAQLGAMIQRNLARFPDEWRLALEPLLHLDLDGLGDGILVQAWAPSTIKRRLEAAAAHFDFCRARGITVDISPPDIRARLREEQVRVRTGSRRMGGVAADIEAIAGLAAAARRDRSWGWLGTTRDGLSKLARHHGSRNAARAVDAAELRAAGQQLLDHADIAHAAARNRRAYVKAHTLARTALTLILLSEAPIRISTCASLELRTGLLDDLAGLYLNAASTKEGDGDRRVFSATLVDAVGRYIRTHRAMVAPPGETRLLVSDRGRPINASQLSQCLGDFTAPVFGVRVTPHAVRHSVSKFIVATAPAESALAGIILNHRGDATTPTYKQRADQIVASRELRRATEQTAADLSADVLPTSGRKKPVRRRPLPGRARRG